jgi:hypothetical protein
MGASRFAEERTDLAVSDRVRGVQRDSLLALRITWLRVRFQSVHPLMLQPVSFSLRLTVFVSSPGLVCYNVAKDSPRAQNRNNDGCT